MHIVKDHYADPLIDNISKREIIIDNRGNSSELNNYQVDLSVDKSHMFFEVQDKLRFVDENLQEVNHWNELFPSALWLKTPKVPASGMCSLQMFCSSIISESKSDGNGAFEFFDDFDRSVSKYGDNPVIERGTPGTFDDQGLYDPSVLKVNGTYYLYYSGYPGTQTITEGLATSTDGYGWTKQGKILDVGAPGTWDDLKAHDVCVLKPDTTWMMWYSGTRDPEATYGLKIGLATSSNGTDWTKDAGNPIFDKGAAGKFDDKHVVYPSVIKEGNTYYMWYSGFKSGVGYSGIGLATSTNGINWTRQNSGNAVFTEGSASWESNYIYQAAVEYIDGKYWMIYTGMDSGSTSRLGLAYSTDKVNWTRFHDNPILDIGGSGECDDEGLGSAKLIEKDSEIWIYYRGKESASLSSICLATTTKDFLNTPLWTEQTLSGTVSFANSKVRVQCVATPNDQYGCLYTAPLSQSPLALRVLGLDIDGIGNVKIVLNKDGTYPLQTDVARLEVYDQAVGGGGNSDLVGVIRYGSGPSHEETWRNQDVGDTYNKTDLDILIRPDRKVEWLIEGASKGVSANAVDDETWRIQLLATSGRGLTDFYLGCIFLRNYTLPEPTATVGTMI